MNGASLNIHFAPLLPVAWLIAAAIAALALAAFSSRQKSSALWMRAASAAAFILALSGPSLIREEREPVKDVAVIVADQSGSQSIGTRQKTAESAIAYLKKEIKKIPSLEVRTVSAPQDGKLSPDTRLFGSLDQALADVPEGRRAGVIFLTDGQVHDVPRNAAALKRYGPAHILLTGERKEKDRRLKILEAPAYGITGQKITVKYVIEDSPAAFGESAEITIDRYDGAPETFAVPVGEELTMDLEITHAGQNIFELKAEAQEGEITQANNRAALIVNGVRDRLRALLISGQPYAGARAWRDLLTSDPSVDLVHFTILRDPEKVDSTPSQELSLIAFPFDELFQVKLYEFDLIIFDRYRLSRILPQGYFSNIAHYVQDGGALLVTSGPDFAKEDSIYFTSLMDVLPGAPVAGEIMEKPFIPDLSSSGKTHPVTRALPWPAAGDGGPGWGPWLRQVSLSAQSGDVLMRGAEDKPLIILDRVGKGRVAQIASDQIWLWARGYQGGGPYAELMRRMVHWLMKEPELDEKGLEIKASGDEISVVSRGGAQNENIVTMTKPDGTKQSVTLDPSADGDFRKDIKADQPGIYAFEDGEGQKHVAVIGEINPPEQSGVIATPDILAPLAKASGGGVQWLSETPEPRVRIFGKTNAYSGYGWLALRSNGDYAVKDVRDTPLLPPWLAAAILISLAAFAWFREGRA